MELYVGQYLKHTKTGKRYVVTHLGRLLPGHPSEDPHPDKMFLASATIESDLSSALVYRYDALQPGISPPGMGYTDVIVRRMLHCPDVFEPIPVCVYFSLVGNEAPWVRPISEFSEVVPDVGQRFTEITRI